MYRGWNVLTIVREDTGYRELTQMPYRIAGVEDGGCSFLTFLLVDESIRIRTKNDGSGSGGPKTYGSYGSGSG